MAADKDSHELPWISKLTEQSLSQVCKELLPQTRSSSDSLVNHFSPLLLLPIRNNQPKQLHQVIPQAAQILDHCGDFDVGEHTGSDHCRQRAKKQPQPDTAFSR